MIAQFQNIVFGLNNSFATEKNRAVKSLDEELDFAG